MSNREFEDFIRHLSDLVPHIRKQMLRTQKNALTMGVISLPQMTILEYLYDRKDCIMSDIAELLLVSMSAATGLADRMIKNGLLKRSHNAKDRRTVIIALTPKGRQMAKSFLSVHRRMIRKVFQKISAQDRRKYLEIVRKVHKNLMTE